MKYKDYKRLSKVSLKSRKKTTRSTVRGISFGLILLMPLLFIVIAFHMDLNKEVNKDASIRVFNLSYVNELSTTTNSVNSIKAEYIDKVYDIKGIENIIKYNQYTFDNKSSGQWSEELQTTVYSSGFTVAIGEKIFSLDSYYKEQAVVNENEIGIQVIDTGVGDSVFIKADSQLTDGKTLLAGQEFSSTSIKEIMVSSNLLSQYNLNVDDVLGKEITLTYQLGYLSQVTTSKSSITKDSLGAYQSVPLTILKDYKVVGIYNSEIYKSKVRLDTQRSYYQENSSYETYFWLKRESLYNASDKSYLPESISIEKDNGEYVYTENVYYYSDTPVNMAKNARNSDMVFIPLGMGVKENSENNNIPLYNTLIEFESYADANNAVSVVTSILELGATGIDDPYIDDNYAQATFTNYRMFYNAFTYVCIVLAIFGGVIFFATLLNLYNTIHYSVQSRRNYLGMIRAIGMRGKDVTKMYFVEIFQIFKRSYIWSAIFGGGICFGISFLFNMIMKSDAAAAITIDLSLNPIYILVAFSALIIANTIISIAFSLVACHNVSNKPILEVLVENR